MKTVALFVATCLFVCAGVAAILYLAHDDSPPPVRPAQLETDVDQEQTKAPAVATPQEAAAKKMRELKSASERQDHLDWIGEQEWAKSNLAVLRTTIVSDPDEQVQIHAVETALKLAQGEGADATSNVVRTSLASTKGNTRARGLKAAREHPDANLVPDLIELVDSQDAYATMALNALAYTDSPEAHAKILALAENGETNRKLRERAVALLAITKDREAFGLLRDLSNGEDETLARIAAEVLQVLSAK